VLAIDETLHTIAEIGVALAGFAALVAIFRQRESGWTAAAVSGLRFMVELSISLIILALLPIPVYLLGMRAPDLWVTCSSICAVVSVSLFTLNALRIRRLYRGGWRPKTWTFHVVGFTVGSAGVFAHILNMLHFQGPGLYVLALTISIFLVGLQFIAFTANTGESRHDA
jgi:hypothetical protein